MGEAVASTGDCVLTWTDRGTTGVSVRGPPHPWSECACMVAPDPRDDRLCPEEEEEAVAKEEEEAVAKEEEEAVKCCYNSMTVLATTSKHTIPYVYFFQTMETRRVLFGLLRVKIGRRLQHNAQCFNKFGSHKHTSRTYLCQKQ